MPKRIIVSIIVVALVGIGLVFWFYRDIFFPKPPEKIYKVAVVLLGGTYMQAVDGMMKELGKMGYIEGENILYYVKDAQGDKTVIGPATEELLQKNPDLFYVISTPPTTEVWKVVKDRLPIVFNIVGDPIGAGFAKSFASSETNLTGCSNLSAQLSGKRLEIFKEAFPLLKKTVTFYDPENTFSQLSIANIREAVPKIGIEVAEVKTKSVDDLKKALAELKPGQYDGIYLTPDAMVISKVDLVIARAKELGLPVMGHEETLAEKGVTVIYGANFHKLGVQCATIVYKILKGEKPQNIPIQGPQAVDLVINLKAAQESGLTIPEGILGKADRVIR